MALQIRLAAGKSGRAAVAGSPEAGEFAERLLRRLRRPLSLCPELDCVRTLLPVRTIVACEQRAIALGVGAEKVLIASGIVSEEFYVKALARHIGLPFETLDELPRNACALSEADLLNAPGIGSLRLEGETGMLVIAPHKLAMRFIALLDRHNSHRRHICLTTNERIQRFVDRHAGRALAQVAANDLKQRYPAHSAAHPLVHAPVTWAFCGLLIAVLCFMFPAIAHATVFALLGIIFAAWTVMRLAAIAVPDRHQSDRVAIPDDELPDYTIIIPLFKESRVVRPLIAALDALDYPREKLSIKFALEPDDIATRHILARLDLSPAYQVVIAPPYGPRTKPKALNAALQFARGEFIAIYDAEDRPEPDQLRRAVACFRDNDDRLACVQARLTIDNTADSWLTRLFTAEYCGLFDVLLPALARWQLPLPLGGTSNHFRADVLRKIGAWDPYNVTEDADLGMRLARLGFKTTVIGSTTYEEAPSRLRPWVHQRSRWFKGWLQTWFVHMRHPVRLFREMGFKGFATFQLVVGGTVLSALVHPLVLATIACDVAAGEFLRFDRGIARIVVDTMCTTIFIAGYMASVALAFAGLSRRHLLTHAHALLMVPVLWLLLSVSAWRAVIGLIHAPYRWDKTEHGAARTSRFRHPGSPLLGVRNDVSGNVSRF